MNSERLREYYTISELSEATCHPVKEIQHWVATRKLFAHARLYGVTCAGFPLSAPSGSKPLEIRKLSGERWIMTPSDLEAFFNGHETEIFLEATEAEKKRLPELDYWHTSGKEVSNVEVIIFSKAYTVFENEYLSEMNRKVANVTVDRKEADSLVTDEEHQLEPFNALKEQRLKMILSSAHKVGIDLEVSGKLEYGDKKKIASNCSLKDWDFNRTWSYGRKRKVILKK